MTDQPVPNFRAVRVVLWQVLVLNLFVALLKIVVGLAGGLLSMVADGFHSVLDGSGNIIGLVALRVAEAPPDPEHPYGHRKAETLASLFIGVLLVFAAYEILTNALDRLSGGAAPTVTVVSFVIMIVTIAINLGVTLYEGRQGRKLDSEVLLADAVHTRTDIWVSVSVIAGLVGVQLGWSWLDAGVGLVIAGIIGFSAIKILSKTVGVLMDRAALPPQKIEDLALSMPGVESVERIRSRGRSDETYVDLHVRVRPDTPVEYAHSIAHAVQHKIKETFPQAIDVTIHIEPEDAPNPEDEEIARKLQSIAHSLGAAVHEIWKHSVNGQYAVELHLEVPPSLSLEEAHALATQLEERGKAAISNVNSITTHIEPMGETVEVSIELEEDTVSRLKANAQSIADAICGSGACHDFRLRTEPGGLALSLHCTLPSTMSIVDAHQTSEKVKEAVLQELPELSRVTVHVEPPGPGQR